ncbi:MAG: hypothetical protein JOY99_08830 [Sphingomonadaceae bacterium]|nr:hypothetical protein [Sphingomonadaceae bacterium]
MHIPMRSHGRPVGTTAHCGDKRWSFGQHHQGDLRALRSSQRAGVSGTQPAFANAYFRAWACSCCPIASIALSAPSRSPAQLFMMSAALAGLIDLPITAT